MIARTIVLLAAASVQLQAQDASTALARAESRYDALSTIQADFSQTLVNRMLGDPETTNGILYLAKPGKFAMRFLHPDGDRLVADGEWLWIYTPTTVPNQVIRQVVPTGGALTPNLFEQFVHRAEERYDATYEGTETIGGELVDVIRLVPREAAHFRSATIAVSRRNGLMVRVHVREESGQDRTLELSNIRPDARIPEEELKFNVPRGTRVVTP